MDQLSPVELFPHVRIVMGMIVGLGITRLLMTVAGMIQHPQRAKLSSLHLLWIVSILVELVLFWWWEFALYKLEHWTFAITLFLIVYAVTLFLLAALLSPDNIAEYDGYEDFFLKRRRWFFGLFAATFFLDAIDTLIKGGTYWQRFGWDYFIQVPFGLVICIIAIRSSDRRIQLAAVMVHLAYQAYWISRFFYTVT
ncbi:hypothetical protein SAMN05428969_1660 [Devosia sp. YR412]|uniref:hypothetical protein n=1 Tax=Devosia sp. YR412 TaxID=1881030 RepID=UPI0008CE119C|nr:hypothetical protein [Devosia sp. YR412]SEQ03936.1 hypothetical protein SAMN05428969_1660 [Devosia sp. YR412]